MNNEEKYFGSQRKIAEFIQDYCQLVQMANRGCDGICTFLAREGGENCPFRELSHEEWLDEETSYDY